MQKAKHAYRYEPSSKPLATPEKLHTAVQKKSHTLKISLGQALTAATVPLRRLGLSGVIVATEWWKF